MFNWFYKGRVAERVEGNGTWETSEHETVQERVCLVVVVNMVVSWRMGRQTL